MGNKKYRLESIAKSYDKAIEYGRKGINLYENLPDYITNNPDYPKFAQLMNNGTLSDSKRIEIKNFLSPEENMNFIDLGCCLNLMFNNYDEWASNYYGVDISSNTIQLLNEYIMKKQLSIGSLFCGSIHETPYEDSFFEIATCIGILEYFEKDFVQKAIIEAHRILKPEGKFVLDIPNLDSSIFGITKQIEEYLGRPDRFDISENDFKKMIENYFEITKTEEVAGMVQFFLIHK
ncbi:class I SAM-dependent methyltransferase [Spirochaeta cellobiosiphila]|uniref:class I SAM-dependent methyltransferase n=1 Tax=Spirochaeta cellobiosiphila TaxID=504483 RepID=UPI0003F533B6|nr:class I SAM-dependent methyltransferase [Spirochaeta cellobiosiphila]